MVLRSVTDAVAPSGTGLKALVTAAALTFSKSCPAERKQLLRLVERDPALDGRAAHVPVRRDEAELLRGLALHDGERIAGRSGLVHDEHRRRASFCPISYL